MLHICYCRCSSALSAVNSIAKNRCLLRMLHHIRISQHTDISVPTVGSVSIQQATYVDTWLFILGTRNLNALNVAKNLPTKHT